MPISNVTPAGLGPYRLLAFSSLWLLHFEPPSMIAEAVKPPLVDLRSLCDLHRDGEDTETVGSTRAHVESLTCVLCALGLSTSTLPPLCF